jgi:hypothetical protein
VLPADGIGASPRVEGASPDTLPKTYETSTGTDMNDGPQTLITVGLLMVFVGFLMIRKTRAKPLKFLFITLMTLRVAAWIFVLGLLAIFLGVAALNQPA